MKAPLFGTAHDIQSRIRLIDKDIARCLKREEKLTQRRMKLTEEREACAEMLADRRARHAAASTASEAE